MAYIKKNKARGGLPMYAGRNGTRAQCQTKKKTRIMKTRKQAAVELQPLYNSMEVRKNTLSTLMRKLWFDGENWRCSGVGYDYTV